jgi:hypothetical protein
MPDVASKRTGLLVLDGVGYVLFAAGAFYGLASNELHERLPFLTGIEYATKIYIGAGVALLGIVLLVVSDKFKRHAKDVNREISKAGG